MQRAAHLILSLLTLLAFVGCADLSSFEEEELSTSEKILGGEGAKAPSWMVSLRFNDQHICGGTLIKKNWVLTAAHCVDFASAESFSVCVGRTKRSQCTQQHVARVNRIKLHAGWNGDAANGNDVAVLRLNKNFNVELATLAQAKQEPRAGALVRARGWGVYRYKANGQGQIPNKLQQIDIPFIKSDSCRAQWADVGVSIPAGVAKRLVCTEALGNLGSVSQGGVCNGDSGGPLTKSGRQIGITSFGASINGQCIAGAPSAFTRVSRYRNWINNNAK